MGRGTGGGGGVWPLRGWLTCSVPGFEAILACELQDDRVIYAKCINDSSDASMKKRARQ